MATPSAIPTDVNRDACQPVRLTRTTKEKRRLHYQLTVLQQPERARACGSGTKANSDRRPIDPPPVVELRIREGPSFDEGKEITFDYNASFFLYASLEHTRKIAQGRMQGQPPPPILTGVPASGMAYLDRPTAAGYFIFPDLSVRHEGQYRLSFSLFETTKEEKDTDLDSTLDPEDSDFVDGCDHRMEIKTGPFDVYSAKKFPGLKESTALSREVAEQGCRIRIRREVRMRKREGKSSGNDGREEEHRRRTVTPASEAPNSVGSRQRSLSAASDHRMPSPAHVSQRPPAGSFAGPPPPPTLPSSDQFSSRLGHSDNLAFGEQRHAPQQPPLAPISPSSSYARAGSYSAYSTARPYPPASPTHRVDGYERRHSANYVPTSPSTYSEGHSRRNSSISHSQTPSTDLRLPSLQAVPKARPSVMSLTSVLAPIEPQVEPEVLPAPLYTGGKRKHDRVFRENSRALVNHQREDACRSIPISRLLCHDPIGEVCI